MKINVRSNTDEVIKGMDRIAKKQIPRATSKAINEIAKMAEGEVVKQIKTLNNPTTFTVKGTFISFSSYRQSPITAIVGVKDIQAGYLQYAEEGGISRAKGKAKPVPTSSFKNKFGNLPKSKTKAIGKGKVFSGKPRGGNRPGGIYQRAGTKKNPKLKQVAHWEAATQHTPKMRIGERVRLIVKRNIMKSLKRQVAAALRSRR